MAKSLRSKRKQRLKAKRRDTVEQYYDEKATNTRSLLDAIVAAPSAYTAHVDAMAARKDGAVTDDAVHPSAVLMRSGGMQVEAEEADANMNAADPATAAAAAAAASSSAMEEDAPIVSKDRRLGVRRRGIGKPSAGGGAAGRKATAAGRKATAVGRGINSGGQHGYSKGKKPKKLSFVKAPGKGKKSKERVQMKRKVAFPV